MSGVKVLLISQPLSRTNAGQWLSIMVFQGSCIVSFVNTTTFCQTSHTFGQQVT